MPVSATEFYHLADVPNKEETGGASLEERYSRRDFRAVFTGEMRTPRKGEWYLSGTVIQAYKAKNDLSSSFHIAKVVKVKAQLTVVRAD